MHPLVSLLRSSLGKKFLMAVTGAALVGFVLVHMLGNLQIFLGPEAINAYAHKLQTLPPLIKWGFRVGLLVAVGIHVWVAVLLTIENRRARPQGYAAEQTIQASYASRTMPITGLIVLFFIIFHLLHYTVRVVPGHLYEEQISFPRALVATNGTEVTTLPAQTPLLGGGNPVLAPGSTGGMEPVMTMDVYNMMVAGFSTIWISIFYLLATGLLCAHVSHGVSSMFQSLGWRNRRWRGTLDKLALAYGWIVFLGFAAIPVAVLAGLIKPVV